MKQNNVAQSSFGRILFNPTLFRDITKKDGEIAFGLVTLFEILSLVIINVTKSYVYIPAAVLFFLVLLVLNKNKLHTLGLTTSKCRITVGIFAVLLVIAFLVNLENIQTGKITGYDFLANGTYYLGLMFFTEEIIFIGYLWPRVVVLLGNHKGTIVCGILYGMTHLLFAYCLGGAAISFLSVFNFICEGILMQYCFSFLYAYSGNIYLPTIIHASYHFFVVEKTFGYFMKIF